MLPDHPGKGVGGRGADHQLGIDALAAFEKKLETAFSRAHRRHAGIGAHRLRKKRRRSR